MKDCDVGTFPLLIVKRTFKSSGMLLPQRLMAVIKFDKRNERGEKLQRVQCDSKVYMADNFERERYLPQLTTAESDRIIKQ